MKTRSTLVYNSLLKVLLISFLLGGCSSIPNIVPQLPSPGSVNSTPAIGQDIAQANNFLAAGKRREAADAYFSAARNYRSPERERLILQAAELASIVKDSSLAQAYLSPLSFDQLSPENQSRFRLIQAQLALNDRNYRETLRILPQRVNDLPVELGQKILITRMSAAQSSGDKLSLVQELVLQEPTLKESYQVSLNHDRIWNHAQQIPALQLNEAKDRINHSVLKNWLSLAQLARLSKNAPSSKKQTLRSDLASWLQHNPTHPGQSRAVSLLSAEPKTTVTPYSVDPQKPLVKKPIVTSPAATNTPAKKSPVVGTPVKKSPVVGTPVKKDPNIKSLYENIKKQIL